MRKRWSDAQYTGRYLRRTIVHGKGETKPKRNTKQESTEESKENYLPIIIFAVITIVVLFCINSMLGGLAVLIAAICISSSK